MSRVPPVPADIDSPHEIVDAIRQRRGGGLFNLDRMLLHSPVFAAGWNEFLGRVRRELDLSPYLRELAICAVAVFNRAEYEYIHHLPEFIAAGGTDEQAAALRGLADGDGDKIAGVFDETARCVIALTQEITQNVDVRDATFAAAEKHFDSTQQLVEIVGVIAAYNMVSRFLVAFNIEPE